MTTLTLTPRSTAEAVAPVINADSQNGKILLHLMRLGSITGVEAHELYRVYRLASRISELKGLGVEIRRSMKTDSTGVRYVLYSL